MLWGGGGVLHSDFGQRWQNWMRSGLQRQHPWTEVPIREYLPLQFPSREMPHPLNWFLFSSDSPPTRIDPNTASVATQPKFVLFMIAAKWSPRRNLRYRLKGYCYRRKCFTSPKATGQEDINDIRSVYLGRDCFWDIFVYFYNDVFLPSKF